MIAEPLSHVLSLAEEKEQKEKRPDQARQVGIHLDTTLTIQTRRGHIHRFRGRVDQREELPA